MLEDK